MFQTPINSYRAIDFRDDAELLKEWGAIHRRHFKWQSGWGDWHEVHSAKHPTEDTANADARKMALDMGYEPPKWYEFWRIGEPPLPPAQGKVEEEGEME